MAREYYQIKNMYKHLKNPQKYLSENKIITARSSWEIKFIQNWLDKRTDVIGWTSEDFYIQYFYPIDKKIHRYFPDFLVKMKDKNEQEFELLIEIKPFVETQPPVIPKRKTRGYIERCNTYIKNKCKWEAAKNWCSQQKNKNITFIIITEKDFPFI